MEGELPRSVIVLSSKSSGSSALQKLLCHGTNARHVQHTRHGEYETLYWTKAASILGLPQAQLLASEVPIAPRKARTDLITLLAHNVPTFVPPSNDEALVFEGWRALCKRFAPVFVEKSPHHLQQWSCLELMASAVRKLPDIEFRFIGLVRNPMDMLYSAWRRWRLAPQDAQYEWFQAHQNLQRFKELVGDRLTIICYETLVSHDGVARAMLNKMEIAGTQMRVSSLHKNSVLSWKRDTSYGFQLDSTVAELAAEYGYTPEQLSKQSSFQRRVTDRPATSSTSA
jgi:hypothetical protein